jgi:hypothetical protein
MSALAINRLIGRVLTSDHARAWVLNGRRDDVLKEFDLDPDEYSDIMEIRANTLQEFSAAVEVIYNRQRDSGQASMSEHLVKAGDQAARLPLSRIPIAQNV